MQRFLILLVLALAGCGSGDSATAPRSPDDGHVDTGGMPMGMPGVELDLTGLVPLDGSSPLEVAPREEKDYYERTVFYATTRDDERSRLARLVVVVAGLAGALGGLWLLRRLGAWRPGLRWAVRTVWVAGFAAAAWWVWTIWVRDYEHWSIAYGLAILALALLPPLLGTLFKPEFAWVIRGLCGVAAVVAIAAGYLTVLPEARAARAYGAFPRHYGGFRGDYAGATGCELGTVVVTIPKDRPVGSVPVAGAGDLTIDPMRHFTMKGMTVYGSVDAWRAALAEPTGSDDAFLFVHGYCNTFEDAVFRTAQIAHDIGYAGKAIAFSWPSRGLPLAYLHDEAEVDAAGVALKRVLAEVRPAVKGRFVLVAHSMGCRVLGRALVSLAADGVRLDPFDAIVIAAPDINEDAFKAEIAPRMRAAARVRTMYVSANDEALKLSQGVHGDRRAGSVEGEPLVVDGIDTIDVSLVSTGHSYIGGSHRVIRDFRSLMENPLPAKDRPVLGRIFDTMRGYYRLVADG